MQTVKGVNLNLGDCVNVTFTTEDNILVTAKGWFHTSSDIDLFIDNNGKICWIALSRIVNIEKLS